jgi:hypothetical protein
MPALRRSRRSEHWLGERRLMLVRGLATAIAVVILDLRLTRGAMNGRNRRNLAVAARSGDGPFTIRFPDLHHRAMQTGGLVTWRSMHWQAA